MAQIEWMSPKEERRTLEVLIGRIERLERENTQKTASGGKFAALIGGMVQLSQAPKIDGRITFADTLSAALWAGGFTLAGLLAGTGVLLTGGTGTDAAHVLGYSLYSGAGAAGVRMLLDGFDPMGILDDVQLYREYKSRRDDFLEWLGEKEADKAINHSIKLEWQDENGLKFLSFEGERARRVIEFSKEYTMLEKTEEYPEAEKFYVGSGKIWSNSQAGRDEWSAMWNDFTQRGWAYQEPGGRRRLRAAGQSVVRRIANQVEI